MRVTDILDLEEFQSLDANNLPSVVYRASPKKLPTICGTKGRFWRHHVSVICTDPTTIKLWLFYVVRLGVKLSFLAVLARNASAFQWF